MISKEKLDFAVKQVVETCLKAKKGEKACVVTDNETKHIGLAIADKLKSAGCIVKTFIMEDFGERPVDGSNPLKFSEEIGKTIDECDVSVYAAQVKANERHSFRIPLLDRINNNPKLRHGHMIGVNDEIMEGAMSVDYQKLYELTNKIGEIVSKATKIKVATQKGTNVEIDLNPSYKWIIGDGMIKPHHWGNLPDGEVFTCPENVNGTVIIDGVLGDYMSEKYGSIEKTPLTIEIQNSFIKTVSCNNKTIEKDVRDYFARGENSDRIGEIGIGTNTALTKLIGKLLQDEKFPGVHIAAGNPFPEKTGASWDAATHLDMVIQKTTIEVDGRMIMKEGKFLI